MSSLIQKITPVFLLGLTLATRAADIPLPAAGTSYERLKPIFHSSTISQEDGDAILAALNGGRGVQPVAATPGYICVMYPPPYHCLTVQQPKKTRYTLSFSYDGRLIFLPDDGMRQLTPDALNKIQPILMKLEDDVKSELVAAPRPLTYVVSTISDGGTLSGISQLFFNSPSRWKDIYNANRTTLKDPNLIRPGMKLVIPK